MEDEARGPGSSDFGNLLRHYRLAAELSQEVLAERARMSVNGVSALERGYRRTPQRGTLSLLAGALALSDEQREEFAAPR
jgi:transcriptional regulator with XRE-family HTH domain